jgi:isochorismate synthase EntC
MTTIDADRSQAAPSPLASEPGETVPSSGATGGDEPVELRLQATTSDADWMAKVIEMTTRMAEGHLEKAVLFRELALSSTATLDPGALYRRLLPTAPAGYVFCIDGFVGASPELLVSRIDDTVRAQPMAGTLPRSGDPKVDMGHAGELLRSDKLRHEHEVTILRAHDALLGWCSYLDAQPEPQVVEAGPCCTWPTWSRSRLSHFGAVGARPGRSTSPDPAVGGWPSNRPLALIDELEGLTAPVGGAVGWWMPTATASLPSHSLRPCSTAAAPASWPGSASSPTAIRRRSWRRPGPSLPPCCST